MFNVKQTMLNEQVENKWNCTKAQRLRREIIFLGVLVPWWQYNLQEIFPCNKKELPPRHQGTKFLRLRPMLIVHRTFDPPRRMRFRTLPNLVCRRMFNAKQTMLNEQ
jgi:hypothetical protein